MNLILIYLNTSATILFPNKVIFQGTEITTFEFGGMHSTHNREEVSSSLQRQNRSCDPKKSE